MTMFDAPPVPLARPAVLTAVFRYWPDASSASKRWEPLPNVRFLGLSAREGAAPWAARIRYALGDPFRDAADPQRLEEMLPYSAYQPRVLKQDDRVVAFVLFPDGSRKMVFSGFFQAPQGDLGPNAEFLTALVLADPVRESDFPLAGAVYRDADNPTLKVNPDTKEPTDRLCGALEARFNPGGLANANPLDTSEPDDPLGDSGEEPKTYPVFCGPFPPDDLINGEYARKWTLPMAARYLCMIGARTTDGKGNYKPSKYVRFGDLFLFDQVLRAVRPADAADAGPINPLKEETYQFEDIDCPDTPVNGMPWPEALWRLIEPYGFGMNWVLYEDTPEDKDYPGAPYWKLDVYRKDWSLRQKYLYAQRAGSDLDPGLTNVYTLSLARDSSGTANQVELDAAPVRVESSFVLAPSFLIRDTDIENPNVYKLGDDGFGGEKEFTDSTRDDYRKFIFDEAGEGHWSASGGSAIVTRPGDLSPAFLLGKKKRNWVIRRRKPEHKLFSKGPDSEPLTASLWVSFDYAGAQPGVWDGTGTWQEIVSGEWELLGDQIGIYVGALDPDNWKVGTKVGGLEELNGGVISLVTWLSPTKPDTPLPRLMLVCCVDTDDDFNVVAPKRAGSPSKFVTVRRVDAADRFRKDVVSRWSMHLKKDAKNFKLNDVTPKDDKPDAQAVADMHRRASESGTITGPVKIRRFTTAYSVGDQVTDVLGRDISLRANAGGEGGEAPVFPVVVAVDYNFDDEQSVTLTLSDHRAAPPPKRGGRRSVKV